MEKRTSITSVRRLARRGYTLGECMVASVLLAMSSASLSGVMAASYQHDRATTQSIQSVQSGQRLLEEVIAMPVSGSTATIMNYDGYTDIIDQDESKSTLSQVDSTSNTSARTAPTIDTTIAKKSLASNQIKRSVSVKRYATLNGQESSTGDFIVVTVSVTRSDGKVTTIKRMLTTIERESS